MLPCKLFGHRWMFKNYDYKKDINGNKHEYKKSRICQRCGKREQFTSDGKWEERPTSHQH